MPRRRALWIVGSRILLEAIALVLLVVLTASILPLIPALIQRAQAITPTGYPVPVPAGGHAVPLAVASADSTVSLARPARSAPAQLAPALIGGFATWYDDGPGFYAAAGPALRQSLGKGWRGSMVRVDGARGSVVVKLVDFCACGKRHGRPTLLDLSPAAFRALAPLSDGVAVVSIELSARRVPDPPATDR